MKSFFPKKITTLIMLIILTSMLSGCNENAIPMPDKAQRINTDEFRVPFPLSEEFSNGTERWTLNKSVTDEITLQITYKNKLVVQFVVNNVGINEISGEIITLDGENFSLKSVTLNSDQESGYAIIQKIG